MLQPHLFLLTSHWSEWSHGFTQPQGDKGGHYSLFPGEWDIRRSTDNRGHLSVVSTELASVPHRISRIWICAFFLQQSECPCPALRTLPGGLYRQDRFSTSLPSLSRVIVLHPHIVLQSRDYCSPCFNDELVLRKIKSFNKSGLTNKYQIQLKCPSISFQISSS